MPGGYTQNNIETGTCFIRLLQ